MGVLLEKKVFSLSVNPIGTIIFFSSHDFRPLPCDKELIFFWIACCIHANDWRYSILIVWLTESAIYIVIYLYSFHLLFHDTTLCQHCPLVFPIKSSARLVFLQSWSREQRTFTEVIPSSNLWFYRL